MDRIWHWAWDRYGAKYSWAMCAILGALFLPHYLLLSCVVVGFEGSDRYIEAAAVTVVAMLVLTCVVVFPGVGPLHLVERWAAGHDVDPATAIEATYTYARGLIVRAVTASAVCGGLLAVIVGAIAGASASRLVQYTILGAAFGAAYVLPAMHSVAEAVLRPVRVTIAADTAIGLDPATAATC